MILFRTFFSYFILLFSLQAPLFAESLVNDSLSLVDKNKTLANPSRSLVNKNKRLVDPSRSLVDKNKTLVNRNLRLTNERKSLVDDTKSLAPIDENAVGTYRKTVNSTVKSTTQNTVQDTRVSTIKDSYANNYGAFLKAVLKTNPQAKNDFVRYFADWQESGQKEDFFSYSSSRAEREKQFEYCYDQAIRKFGIGAAIVATTWAAAVIVPGGTITYSAILIVAKTTTLGAFSGAVFDGIIAGGVAAFAGYTSDQIIYETINGAADGLLVGAAVGFAGGVVHVGIMAKNAKRVAEKAYIVFDDKLYDKSGQLIIDLAGFSDAEKFSLWGFLENGDNFAKAFDRLDKLRILRLKLENGEISNVNFWESIAKEGWPKEICEDIIKRQIKFGKYLRNLIGPFPEGMIDPHAHHILPKVGKGSVQQSLVRDGQEILRSYGIDPILGRENLCWAPNKVVGQHSESAIREIVDGLKVLRDADASREDIVDFLKLMGQKAAERGL